MKTLTEYSMQEDSKRRLLLFVAFPVVLVLLLAVYGGYRFLSSRMSQSEEEVAGATSAGEQLTPTEQQQLVLDVSAMMVLPEDEEPTIALVSDAERLRDQLFFSQAQNGDIVLVYNGVKKAILYRPGTKQIVEVAPIDAPLDGSSTTGEALGDATVTEEVQDEPEGTITPTTTPAPVRIAVWNGTRVGGAARRYGEELEEDGNIEIVELENASKRDHKDTFAVILSETRKSELEAYINGLGLQYGDMPEGDSPPDADVLIILGSDQAS